MDNDKKLEYLHDALTDEMSDCCGPNLFENMICSACKEHSGKCKHEDTIDVGDDDRGSELICTNCGK